MSALKSKYDPSGGNFLRVNTSYREIPNEKMSTYKNKHHIRPLVKFYGNPFDSISEIAT